MVLGQHTCAGVGEGVQVWTLAKGFMVSVDVDRRGLRQEEAQVEHSTSTQGLGLWVLCLTHNSEHASGVCGEHGCAVVMALSLPLVLHLHCIHLGFVPHPFW